MKKYYGLIGKEVEAEKWAITYEDVSPALPEFSHISQLISASSWPVLFYHQIPQRLLSVDPGFPVLMRERAEGIHLPEWVHRPLLPDEADFSSRYYISSADEDLSCGRRLLFLCSSSEVPDWDELLEKYPADQHGWLWLGKEEEKRPDYPILDHFSFSALVHFALFRPTRLIDLTFGQRDTYTPFHLYCLLRGVAFEPFALKSGLELRQAKENAGSKWLIFR